MFWKVNCKCNVFIPLYVFPLEFGGLLPRGKGPHILRPLLTNSTLIYALCPSSKSQGTINYISFFPRGVPTVLKNAEGKSIGITKGCPDLKEIQQ